MVREPQGGRDKTGRDETGGGGEEDVMTVIELSRRE